MLVKSLYWMLIRGFNKKIRFRGFIIGLFLLLHMVFFSLQTPFWLGYDVSSSWESHDCTIRIEPSIVQYRRVFNAKFTGKSVKQSFIKP